MFFLSHIVTFSVCMLLNLFTTVFFVIGVDMMDRSTLTLLHLVISPSFSDRRQYFFFCVLLHRWQMSHVLQHYIISGQRPFHVYREHILSSMRSHPGCTNMEWYQLITLSWSIFGTSILLFLCTKSTPSTSLVV